MKVSNTRKNVLVIAYHLPPLGGVPVMRALRLIRYLPEFGWQPTVITVNCGFDFVHGFDESLTEKLPPSVDIIRINDPLGRVLKWLVLNFKRQSHQFDRLSKILFFPDEKILWALKVNRQVLHALNRKDIDLIFATGFPWSTLLLGMRLKSALHRPIVIDLRDAWSLSSHPVWKNIPLHRILELKIMKNADKILFTSENTTEDYKQLYPELADKMLCIPNGFDPQDFGQAVQKHYNKSNGKLKFIYAGSLSDVIPPKDRAVSFVPLLEYLRAFKEKYPEQAKRILLEIFSNDIPNTHRLAEKLQISELIRFRTRIPYNQIIEKMRESDYGIVIVRKTSDARQMAPAKLYEYIAAGLPVLALTPDFSEAAKIIKKFQLGPIITYEEDVERGAEIIYQCFANNGVTAKLKEAQAFYNGINLVGKFAEIFDHLVNCTKHEAVTS